MGYVNKGTGVCEVCNNPKDVMVVDNVTHFCST